MKEEFKFPKPIKEPVLFVDDVWPQPDSELSAEEAAAAACKLSEYETQNFNEVTRWRLQTLLAIHPWGIPSLAFSKAFQNRFGRELNVQDLGFETFSDMISQYTDVFTVQEPDEVTALMFPDYPHDRILHDARLQHDFNTPVIKSEHVDYRTGDWETLIAYAWINRDDDIPNDIVLPGEQYVENILPMTKAKVAGSRGLYQGIIVGAANPEYFHVIIRSEAMKRVDSISHEISEYFQSLDASTIATYSVPKEFIFPGFPCLLYMPKLKVWERVSIIARSKGGNKILVESVDFGGLHSVNPLCLYLMPRVFFDLPKQNVPLSLIGLKPNAASEHWSSAVGHRMLHFSEQHYWLDILLVERKETNTKPVDTKSSESSGCESGSPKTIVHKKSAKHKKRRDKVQFEALVCDRNDSDLDVHLDEILLMENYAILDTDRANDIACLKEKFNQALVTVPRPENPLK